MWITLSAGISLSVFAIRKFFPAEAAPRLRRLMALVQLSLLDAVR